MKGSDKPPFRETLEISKKRIVIKYKTPGVSIKKSGKHSREFFAKMKCELHKKFIYTIFPNLFFDCCVPRKITPPKVSTEFISVDGGHYGGVYCDVQLIGKSLTVCSTGICGDDENPCSDDKKIIYKKIKNRYVLQSMTILMQHEKGTIAGISNLKMSVKRLANNPKSQGKIRQQL